MQNLVSVNLLTYNGEKYIKNCLKSVLEQTYSNIEILIIDNASTDKTAAFIKNIKNTKYKTKVIFNPENIGFAAGHNQAIRESKGEFIFCLNQDVVLDRNFVQMAIEIFKKDNNIAAVQGKLLRWSGEYPFSDDYVGYKISHIIDTTGLLVLKNRRIINRGQGEIDQGQFEQSEEILGADGAVPVYRREALEDIRINKEYFDEDFFCYKEDVDLAWRLRLYNWKTIYQPMAVAWHARTAGDSAATTYFGIFRERRKISKFAKCLAFKNQRLMQIKNEQFWLLLRHLPRFLAKEFISWIFVLFFEHYTWRAIIDLFKQMPRAWQKRKVIMAKKRVEAKEMRKWFK